jgi:hypothetical protein
MRKSGRYLSFLLVFSLCDCVARKLPVVPVSAYGAQEDVKLSEAEAEILLALSKTLAKKDGKARLVPDSGLMSVARGMVNRSISMHDDALAAPAAPGQLATPSVAPGAVVAASEARVKKHPYMRDNLFEAGVTDAVYQRKAISKGYNDGLPQSEELEDLVAGLSAVDGKIHVGVAALADGANSARHYALVASERVLSFSQLPRRAEPSSPVTIAGTFHATPTRPELWLSRADGAVEGRSLKAGTDGKFSERIDLPEKPGQYVIEIVDFDGAREHLRAAAAIGVGEPVRHWPPWGEEIKPTTAIDLENAINKALGAARGSNAYQGRGDVLEAAKSCAAALASGAACNPSLSAPFTRVIGDGRVRLEDAELWVTETSARPSVKALLGDQRVGFLGIAASPIKDKQGHYAVAIVFAGEAGPAAK